MYKEHYICLQSLYVYIIILVLELIENCIKLH